MKKSKKHTDPETVGDDRLRFPSMAAAARQTGVPYSVLRAAKRNGAGGFHASGRMELKPVLEWWFGQDGNEPKGVDDMIKDLKVERERFKLDRERGRYYDAEQFDEAIRRTFSQMMAELHRRFVSVAPGEAAQKRVGAVRKVNEAQLRAFAEWAQREADKLAKGETT